MSTSVDSCAWVHGRASDGSVAPVGAPGVLVQQTPFRLEFLGEGLLDAGSDPGI